MAVADWEINRLISLIMASNEGTYNSAYNSLLSRAKQKKGALEYYQRLKEIFHVNKITSVPEMKFQVVEQGHTYTTTTTKLLKAINEDIDLYLLATALGIWNYKHGIISHRTYYNATKRTIENYLWLKPVYDVLNAQKGQYSGNYKKAIEVILNVLDNYLNQLKDPVNEYSDPDKLVEVVEMATGTNTNQTNQTNASSIFTELLDAVYGILGSIVNALKNYATQIAEILVAGMLGYSVIRYGRTIINGVVNMVSGLF